MSAVEMIFPETHTEHCIKRALIRHGIVLELPDIKKLIGKIRNGKYFVISIPKKNCGSFCPVKRDGCVPLCLMVNHKSRDNVIFPLPVVYCEVKRELITVLPKGCREFKKYKKRPSSR